MKALPEVLVQRFWARFDDRVRELERLARAGDVPALELAFHSIAGIGGTYGFPEITRVARDAEERCAASSIREVWRAIEELERIRDGWRGAA